MLKSSLKTSKVIYEIIQMRPIPGNVEANLWEMRNCIAQARMSGANVVVFPELAVSGYLVGDRWEHKSFLRAIEAANEAIRQESKHGLGITVIWGSVRVDWDRVGLDGRVRKYNAAFIARNGEWVSNDALCGWVPKTNMPGYGIFDDARYFYPADRLAAEKGMSVENLLSPFHVELGDTQVSVGLTVCEDIWDKAYAVKPAQIYGKHGVDLLVNISCSPWTVGKQRARERTLKERVEDSGVPILYVNALGLQNNIKNLVWFDGGSLFVSGEGEILWRADRHTGRHYTLEVDKFGSVRQMNMPLAVPQDDDIADAFTATVQAMQSFFPEKMKAIIGLSGGIDSAVSAALLVEALGKENVLAVNMPTEYNSRTTQDLARQCAENLGVEYIVVPIQRLYEERLAALATKYPNPPMLVKENIQARERGNMLAGIAACEGGVVVCNGNKTEAALNYFTLNGDSVGAAAFLADYWKGQVYELARFYNEFKGKEVIPQGIIDIVPSAELSADQNVDEGKGDPIFYPYHDKLLPMFAERQWDLTVALRRLMAGTLEDDIGCPRGTLRKYFSSPLEVVKNLEWAWKMYNIEYKRGQFPPVFIASRRAFGFDWRGTIAEAHVSDEYSILKTNYLKRMEGGWENETD